MDKREKDEKNRLIELLHSGKVAPTNKAILYPVIDNLAWQKVKLDDIMSEIAGASVIVKYDNGGGQSGIRENPIFTGYEKLWKAYMQGITLLAGYLPKDLREETVKDGNSVLEVVKNMKGA